MSSVHLFVLFWLVLAGQTSGTLLSDMVSTLNKHIEVIKGPSEFRKLPAKLDGFKFINCGNKTDLGEISNIAISPDPLRKKANVSFSFEAFVKADVIGKPIALNSTLEAFLDDQWRLLPCYGYIGSCMFDNICDIISEFDCPQVLLKQGIHCKCPYYHGRYYLPTTDFYLEDGFYPTSYRIRLELSHNALRVACAQVSFVFA
ncbi:hypothetical protein RRG08_009326 [Elysia crispata]|uniref:MD-2-related lipid-recognition domain-containing protein n=1 Tax=Elysia crispata TaxID=231223 RepID=A0AAE0ZUR8_9GAST|nr:hypothetical protein RRG08_009326 [Elysia crispata]